MTVTTTAPNKVSRVPAPMRASNAYARAMAVRAMRRAANDNGGNEGMLGLTSQDPMLRAALRHFADHGLGAAREARSRAEYAFFEGDRAAYDWWLGITRTLDRRLANEASRSHARPTLELL